MKTMELIETLNKQNVRLLVDKGELKVIAPVGILTDDLKTALREHKSEIVRVLRVDDIPLPLPESLQRTIQKEEAVRLYRERGWVQIHSGYLGASIYLVKSESVKTPDAGILRYTENEVLALAGLNPDEIKTMHKVKAVFGGNIKIQDERKCYEKK